MPSDLHTVASQADVALAIKAGEAALCPWERLAKDAGPLDWANVMVNFGTLLGFRVGISHVAKFQLTVAVNALDAPSLDQVARAMAELEYYRDHDSMPPTKQALLLRSQYVPRLKL